jgi:hypothetical protein
MQVFCVRVTTKATFCLRFLFACAKRRTATATTRHNTTQHNTEAAAATTVTQRQHSNVDANHRLDGGGGGVLIQSEPRGRNTTAAIDSVRESCLGQKIAHLLLGADAIRRGPAAAIINDRIPEGRSKLARPRH